MKAIISDIHGNLEALQTVLADIQTHSVDEIYCLGDIVGYGPNPCECVDLVKEHCRVVILGNHDQGALFDPEGFNAGAERAIFWTRKKLESGDPKQNEIRWEFLGERPRMHRDDNCLFVHGSARNPLNEYVFPEDCFNQSKMDRIFALVDQYCFQGHTHIPGIFTDNNEFKSPEEINFEHVLNERKTLINVGSVGQPRNGDPRSSYVLLDGQNITFKRVQYDFETTAKKIYDEPDLDDYLGDRLRGGK